MYRILHIPTSTFLYTRKEYLSKIDKIGPVAIWCQEEIEDILTRNNNEYVKQNFSIIHLDNKKLCEYVLSYLKNNGFPDNELYQNLLNYEIIEIK